MVRDSFAAVSPLLQLPGYDIWREAVLIAAVVTTSSNNSA